MKELFDEYFMFSLDVIVGVMGMVLFKELFWGSESLLANIIDTFMGYLV